MRIRGKKIISGSYRLVALVLVVWVMVVIGLWSKWKGQEPLLAYLVDSGEINQEMVQSSSYSSFRDCFTCIHIHTCSALSTSLSVFKCVRDSNEAIAPPVPQRKCPI